ncbi:MAG: phosphatidylglycerol lysyltransferase domain-containing protein [bacterium]
MYQKNEALIINESLKENFAYERMWIRIVAVCLFIMGIIDILSAWFSFDYIRLNLLKQIFEYQIITGSRFLVIITGIASLIIAPALYRQKRIAWYVSIGLLGLSGFAHIIKGADVEEAGLGLVLLGILLPLFKYCRVKSDPVRLIHGRTILLASILFVAAYTALGIYVFSDQLGISTNTPLWHIIANALMFDVSGLHPTGLESKFYVDTLFVINSIAYITGLIFALSPVIAKRLPDINIDKLHTLANECASQPVQFFTLSNDYQHFYYKNDNVDGYISYKVINRVALAIGNPCVKGDLKEFVSKWLLMLFEHDWVPAVYQAQGDFFEILKTDGFQAVPVGVEAVIMLETFSLDGKARQQLRTAKNKAQKEGWVLKEYSAEYWNSVKNLDNKWLTNHGNKENSFAMGQCTPEYLESTRTVLLFDKNNNLLAYVNNIELPEKNGRSIDLMRRDPDSPPGAMDYIILNEILQAKEEGKTFYDLGFSPLAKVDEAFSDNKIVTNLFKMIYEKQRKYYDFQGLYQFKSKFLPVWEQSYLVCPGRINLPQVLIALLDLNKGK